MNLPPHVSTFLRLLALISLVFSPVAVSNAEPQKATSPTKHIGKFTVIEYSKFSPEKKNEFLEKVVARFIAMKEFQFKKEKAPEYAHIADFFKKRIQGKVNESNKSMLSLRKPLDEAHHDPNLRDTPAYKIYLTECVKHYKAYHELEKSYKAFQKESSAIHEILDEEIKRLEAKEEELRAKLEAEK